ncbi:MAG: Stress protein UspA-like protein [Verrucomicrobiales bacterium]|nr:Stress protein UspA-like protein [Verrucomicrobiales bacterium]
MKIKKIKKTGGVALELAPEEQALPGTASESKISLKKVLVPVDFSDCSEKTVRYALAFAAGSKAEVVFVHIVEPYTPTPEMLMIDVASIESAAYQAAKKLLRRIVTQSKLIAPCSSEIRIGKPWVEIIRLAKESGADLIVVSTHGRTGLAHVLLGSTAEQIVRHAGCPVLVVREKERDFVA